MDDGGWEQAGQGALAGALEAQLQAFLLPLLVWLDCSLDARLVRTLAQSVRAIVCWRNRAHGLVLSELGAYLAGPAHAPAGTKRLSNLLRSPRWTGAWVERYLWQRATERVRALAAAAEPALVAWDESVLEKPESAATAHLCPVRSSKAGRLAKSKVGYFQPPGRPVRVLGLHWAALLVLGLSEAPTLAAMRWWSTRGPGASDKRSQARAMLDQAARAWGRGVLHLFDRGFAGTPWLLEAAAHEVRFILRWPKRYKLADLAGQERPAWQLARGKRSWARRHLWDGRRRCWRATGVLALPVRHGTHPQPLWLVIARRGHGESPWYLLTTEPIAAPEDAWRVVLAYARRWQIEQTWRYGKSELACESPRLWTWERRHKLLLLASLAYAYLLSLLDPALAPLCRAALRLGCHRTGKRCRDAPAPLYRLRSALSRLWLACPPSPRFATWQNSG